MKRTSLAAVAMAAALLMTPGIAAAAHGSHAHHKAHRAHVRKHARRHRVIVLGSAPTAAIVLAAPSAAVSSAPAQSGAVAKTTVPTPEGIGTVQSFTGGILTIALNGGSTIAGAVTESTDIRCAVAKPAEGGDESKEDDGEDSESKGDESKGDDGEEGDEGSGADARSGVAPTGTKPADSSAGQGDGEDGGSTEACTTAALTPGAVVGAAELSLGSTGPVWERVQLGA